ncbi:calcium-binding protein [Streptomyces uncialis]|uniref:calcium-binding protein n=1 Tax=Streptomyces uncialis TaxID=1048205 RepID=UPI00386CD612|nr:calcium-binding protein [Streptomyces uncialis]
MRIRVSAAVVTGALAVSALAVPAAQAAPGDDPVKLSNIKVNGGKDVVVGTTAKKTFTITFTASHSSNVYPDANISVWRGSNADAPAGIETPTEWSTGADACKETSATTSSCKATFVLDPSYLENADAATWKTDVLVQANEGLSQVESTNIKSWRLQRLSKLTVNAAPEPIKKGKTLTVTGALTRANWDTEKYAGYTSQPVKLQYQKRGSTAWSTVKTVKSDGRGNLKTTVKATADGSFRYSFAGTSTTPAVNSGADYVDVR